jgi:hypothetical protein
MLQFLMGNQIQKEKIENIILTLDPENQGTVSGKSIFNWITDEQYIRLWSLNMNRM